MLVDHFVWVHKICKRNNSSVVRDCDGKSKRQEAARVFARHACLPACECDGRGG